MASCDHPNTTTYNTEHKRWSSRILPDKTSKSTYYLTVTVHTKCTECQRVISSIPQPESGPHDS